MAKRGRPTDFKPEYVEQVERFCAVMGTLDVDIAQFFNVCVATIGNWKNEHPEFLEAITRGKAVTDQKVVQKLIDRTMGAEWIEQKEVKLKRTEYENGKKVLEEETVEIVDLKKAAPPDTPAIALYLHNRRPDMFRQRQEVVHASDKEAPPVFTLKIDNS